MARSPFMRAAQGFFYRTRFWRRKRAQQDAALSFATIFAAGELGFRLDPSDISSLFQDTAGTTPVTTAGQSVARINDKSGRGFNFTQGTAGARPTYQIDAGGKPYLNFDGTDDILVNTTAAPLANAAGGMTLIAAIQGNATAGAIAYAECSSSTTNPMWQPVVVDNNSPFTDLIGSYRNDDGATSPISTTNTSVAAGFGQGVPKILTTEDTRSQFRQRVNRSAWTTAAYTRGAITVNQSSIGARYRQTTASGFLGMRLYGLVGVARILTSNEETYVENQLAAACGVTLP